ncbi:hypothetical protein ACFV2Q_31175 [Streptomyces sp. NPDC059650]|uniref:hypothetical protein n=1 Tax=Streptomyces sp. NPDC059650 TaxID=3346896 RepID=UPI0036BDF6A9
MPYEIGAKVRLTRDVQITANDAPVRIGFPGPLFLGEGLEGIVTGAGQAASSFAQEQVAMFDQQIRQVQLTGFAASLVEQFRQQVVGHGSYDAGVGSQTRYKVRFENGFVLDGLGEDGLTRA